MYVLMFIFINLIDFVMSEPKCNKFLYLKKYIMTMFNTKILIDLIKVTPTLRKVILLNLRKIASSLDRCGKNII